MQILHHNTDFAETEILNVRIYLIDVAWIPFKFVRIIPYVVNFCLRGERSMKSRPEKFIHRDSNTIFLQYFEHFFVMLKHDNMSPH